VADAFSLSIRPASMPSSERLSMSSILSKRVYDRFPKKWLILPLFFLSAELPGTASGENPAPRTGAPSAFNGTTSTISLL
ncbi:MAG: hypothetical protein JO266_00670, partial [Acidobacteria bacterium]|nr:hypothetical protein [Acidobacteriota bacterium]